MERKGNTTKDDEGTTSFGVSELGRYLGREKNTGSGANQERGGEYHRRKNHWRISGGGSKVPASSWEATTINKETMLGKEKKMPWGDRKKPFV